MLNIGSYDSDYDILRALDLIAMLLTKAMNHGKFSLIYRVYRQLNFHP